MAKAILSKRAFRHGVYGLYLRGQRLPPTEDSAGRKEKREEVLSVHPDDVRIPYPEKK
jgi:hypothetical protein